MVYGHVQAQHARIVIRALALRTLEEIELARMDARHMRCQILGRAERLGALGARKPRRIVHRPDVLVHFRSLAISLAARRTDERTDVGVLAPKVRLQLEQGHVGSFADLRAIREVL